MPSNVAGPAPSCQLSSQAVRTGWSWGILLNVIPRWGPRGAIEIMDSDATPPVRKVVPAPHQREVAPTSCGGFISPTSQQIHAVPDLDCRGIGLCRLGS